MKKEIFFLCQSEKNKNNNKDQGKIWSNGLVWYKIELE